MPLKRYRIAAALYFGVISFLSHIPGQSLQTIPLDVSDKILHLILYLPLGFFLWAGLFAQGQARSPRSKWLLFVAMAIALGGLDEIHQWFVPGRFASAMDTAADVAGCVFGAGCRILWSRRKR